MNAFETNINIQTLIGLFFLAACLVTAIFGLLLWRFEFLDGKSFYFSRTLGRILVLVSGILAMAALMMLIYVRATM